MARSHVFAALTALALGGSSFAQTATLTPSAPALNPAGGTMRFDFRSTFSGSALFKLDVTIPSGWVYLSGTGEPGIRPGPGAENSLSWLDLNSLPSPVQFNFNVSYPAGVSSATIASSVTLRQDGGRTDLIPPLVSFGAKLALAAQPLGQSVALGGTATFSVVANGIPPFSYQWRRNGAVLAGATAATLAVTGARSVDAGSYSVAVTSAAGTVSSTVATLTVTPPTGAPAVLVEPIDVVARAGARAVFTVGAGGAAPLSYQWRKNGTPLTGATSATLGFAAAQAPDAGSYSVTITNALGAVSSRAATLAIRGRSYAGTWIGGFASGGAFALLVRDDNTGVFLGYAPGSKTAFLNREVVVDDDGRFRIVAIPSPASPTVGPGGTDEIAIDATLTTGGALNGAVSRLGTTLAAMRSPDPGATSAIAGFYQAGAANASSTTYTIVSPAGQAYLLLATPMITDAGGGTVDAAGRFAITTASNATVVGLLAAETASLTARVETAAGARLDVVGGRDGRVAGEKLVNIATRGSVSGTAGAMFAGFYLRGDAPRQVMIRAIGPTLAAFGVERVLGAPRLELFSGAASVATSGAWGASSNAGAIAAAAARSGAFALNPASRDAVLLVTLEPGSYTAVVSGEDGSAGVALVEVYDVSENATAAQRIINLASRGAAGSGDDTLTAGFYISGTVPKRVLLRGVGPALEALGVSGTLADPTLKLFNQSGAIVATNDNWGETADGPAIASTAAVVGAFALPPGGRDAALLLNLAPGLYTAQVAAPAGTSGAALVEIYEVP